MQSNGSRALVRAITATAIGGLGVFGVVGAATASAAGTSASGLVFVSSNSTAGNAIDVFIRQPDGSLVAGPTYPTGGLGTGTPGSQGGVSLSADGKTLVVVDGGSSQISDFAVASDGTLHLRNVIGSGGTDPTSVAIKGNLVEVLNSTSLNVSGFIATSHGLVQVAGGSQPLSATAAGPEDVTISPDGTHVVVTEKTSDTIDTFAVGNGDTLAPVVTSPSNGPGAFASAFTRTGQLLVADAGGAGTSAVSSYTIGSNGALSATQSALPNSQSAACWIAIGAHGTVFVANAGSSSISTYRVIGGQLGFFGNTTLASSAKPLDEVVSSDGADLYVLDAVNNQIDTLSVSATGGLTEIGTPPSIAAGSLGIAAG